ncbi:hypothetical protein NDU88_003393 [Pleurodeles waltl]|uniref:Uncharacterized protein n=1 Tax=Pleurodeles waltl TaxID=8319 RepID=A0AAV7NGJ3_PLEWA|nr:hypothetical protein NDU88_003393 [Pleurodeles waltl]
MGLRRRGTEKGNRGPMGVVEKNVPDDSNRIHPQRQRSKKRERHCLEVSAARTASQMWTQISDALSPAPRG